MLESLKDEMASKVIRWLKDEGYPFTKSENDYTLLDVDTKVSSHVINICIPSYKKFDNVHIRSKIELSSDEKAKLDAMEPDIRHRFLVHIKLLGLKAFPEMHLIYGMEWSGFRGIEFCGIIQYEEFNKKTFLETISYMVKVLDLVNLEYDQLRS